MVFSSLACECALGQAGASNRSGFRKTSAVTVRDLLGHRLITSTQIYLHVTAEDLRAAAASHPIERLAPTVEFLLPNVKLPLQYAPQRRSTG